MQCGAKTRSGEPCASKAMPNGRCRMHGGTATGAPIKTGLRSKYLPKRLAPSYEEAMADGELTELSHELAVVSALIDTGLQDVDFDNCEAMWDSLCVLAKDSPSSEEQGEWIRQVLNIVRDGVEEWRKVHRVLGYIEQKRKLAETESKRMRELEGSLNTKQANALIAAVLASVNKNVTDHDARVRVASDLAALVHQAA